VGEPFRVVTWNLRCASADSGAWNYLRELDPDVALLQEVGPVPPAVTREYDCRCVPAMGQTAPQKFHTAILVRGQIGPSLPLNGPRTWIDAILAAYAGNLPAHELHPRNGPPLKVMSVYSPPFKIPPHYLDDADLDALGRSQQKGVWLTDVLLAALEHSRPDPEDRWIIAGDLNLAETFDRTKWSAGGNRAWLDRMSGLGFIECLRLAQGAPRPTFRHSRGWISHQMDHMFVSRSLASQLVTCETGNRERVFASPLLSDHLPVVASLGPLSV
jgi:exonuclease III